MEIDEPDHDSESPGSYAEFRFDFLTNEDGSIVDDNGGSAIAVRMHIHGVQPGALVDALLASAVSLVQQGMSRDMFNEAVPDNVRDHAAAVLAQKYLADRLRSGEVRTGDLLDATVPDDASDLFDD